MHASGVGAGDQGSPLASDNVAAWWQDVSPELFRLTQWMEKREDWVVVPDDEFIDLLETLVEKVGQSGFAQALETQLASEASELFAMLSSSLFLRMLDMMDRRAQGIVTRLVFVFGQLGGDASVYADLFFERLRIVHESELRGNIFSRQRMESIASAVQMVCETRGKSDA